MREGLYNSVFIRKDNMDVKSVLELSVKKNDNEYRFCMPIGVAYGEAYDACFEALDKVREMAADAVKKAKRQEEKKEEDK